MVELEAQMELLKEKATAAGTQFQARTRQRLRCDEQYILTDDSGQMRRL